jgi:hypothetical protein
MFNLAKPNVRINGQAYETFIEATEPWDEALDHRMWSIATEKDSWMDEVAVLRKSLPGQVQAVDLDLERRRTNMEWLPEGEDEDGMSSQSRGLRGDTDPGIDGPKEKAVVPPPPRQEEVKALMEDTIANISELVQVSYFPLTQACQADHISLHQYSCNGHNEHKRSERRSRACLDDPRSILGALIRDGNDLRPPCITRCIMTYRRAVCICCSAEA